MGRSDAGENDRRLVLLTDRLGVTDVIAKGARKAGSRLAGSSEPLVLAEFTWAEGRARRFVQHVKPITSFPGVRKDYDRMMAALAWCDTLRTYIPHGAPADDYFELCLKLFCSLEVAADSLPPLAWALTQLMTIDGVAPEWMNYSDTGNRVSKTPVPFDFSVCGLVEFPDPSARQLEWIDTEILIGLDRMSSLELPPEKLKHVSETLMLVKQVLEYSCDRKLVALSTLVSDLRSSY